MKLAEWNRRIGAIDARLSPIANRPVRDLAEIPPAPLEEAGVREETEALLGEILAAYRTCSPAGREAIRALWRTHLSFAWAASLPFEPMTAERFRRPLRHGLDARDHRVA